MQEEVWRSALASRTSTPTTNRNIQRPDIHTKAYAAPSEHG
jgi:hypothetical protein